MTWLALKFLIGMTAYRKCLTRQRIAFLKMVDILRPSIPLIEKIPELNPSLSDLKNASKIIQTEANPNYRFGDLANGASMRLPIEEERTDYLALRYRLPLGSEEFIPWMEAKRLRFLLYADVGWEGGNACA